MADENLSSYTKSDCPDFIDDEKTQLSIDPKVQTYLAQMSQNYGCWGRCFPIPFERAAEKSWWDPTFDSEILEEQFRISSNPQSKRKFRYIVLIFKCQENLRIKITFHSINLMLIKVLL